jgi:hypothetical protein
MNDNSPLTPKEFMFKLKHEAPADKRKEWVDNNKHRIKYEEYFGDNIIKWTNKDMLDFLDFFNKDEDNGRSSEFRIARTLVLKQFERERNNLGIN